MLLQLLGGLVYKRYRSCIASCNRWKVCDYMQDYLALPGVVKFGFVASETQTMHLD